MTQEFEREQRYVVLKVKDVMQRLSEKDILTLARILDEIDAYRKSIGKNHWSVLLSSQTGPNTSRRGKRLRLAPPEHSLRWSCRIKLRSERIKKGRYSVEALTMRATTTGGTTALTRW